jgi:hypothetical protein
MVGGECLYLGAMGEYWNLGYWLYEGEYVLGRFKRDHL